MCKFAYVLTCWTFGLAFAVAQTPYAVIIGKSTSGNDINCGYKENGRTVSFCKVCNGVGTVAAACDQNSKCKGFDMEDGKCGYLKTAAPAKDVVPKQGFTRFCKMGAGCAVAFPQYLFASNTLDLGKTPARCTKAQHPNLYLLNAEDGGKTCDLDMRNGLDFAKMIAACEAVADCSSVSFTDEGNVARLVTAPPKEGPYTEKPQGVHSIARFPMRN